MKTIKSVFKESITFKFSVNDLFMSFSLMKMFVQIKLTKNILE